ncbi:MAG: phosphopantothenoylcysteine decarboxylase [Deltaproteobacteria bacterium]|nr:MAG: phosphopantothenoylcysteine decarboxylase [Deltaproteobacteria bacterium]
MNILLGVSGGIAAYKACELVSRMVKQGHRIRVIMTPSATHFVGAVTFEALSGEPVMLDTFATGAAPEGVGAVEHINLAKWADVAVLAPATASTLGKIANGIADNALTTVFMALPRGTPAILAPAMNTEMWEHPAVKRNMDFLAGCGRYAIVEPVEKRLACGDVGVGGLADVEDILAAVLAAGA